MKLSNKEIVLFAILGTLLIVGQITLSYIPNVEIVSFSIILYGMVFGRKSIYSILIFVLVEGVLYGFGPWWIGYVIIWPLLLILTLFLKKWFKEDFLKIAIFSGAFGIVFGALFAVPYIIVGDFGYALAFWLNGLIFDVVHMIGNYFIMLIMGKIAYRNLIKLKTLYFNHI